MNKELDNIRYKGKIMFYTKIARLVLYIMLTLGILRFSMGLSIATGVIVESEPGRYLGTATSGEAIDKGLLYILIAIILGVLVEISKAVHEKAQENPDTKK